MQKTQTDGGQNQYGIQIGNRLKKGVIQTPEAGYLLSCVARATELPGSRRRTRTDQKRQTPVDGRIFRTIGGVRLGVRRARSGKYQKRQHR